MPQARTDEPTLKQKLFKAISTAYSEAALSITEYLPGHTKLAARRLVHPHVGVRIVFQTPEGQSYAVAGMLQFDATDKDVTELMARLADDKRRAEDAATPRKPA